MIKITNQEEFEKCLPMLDSPDVECRLLGWQLLRGCTDLRRGAALVWSYYNRRRYNLKFMLSTFNDFAIYSNNGKIERVSYSFLISNFTKRSKIFFGKDYLILRNGRTSQ
jgi:hypothetical protein